MSYLINAWWEGRGPRLEILDASSGAVRMAWQPQPDDAPAQCPTCTDPACPHRASLQRLFRELFLLACASRLDIERSLRAGASTRPLAKVIAFPVASRHGSG